MKFFFLNFQKLCFNASKICQWSYETVPRVEGYCLHQSQLTLAFVCITDGCNGKEMDNIPNFDVEYGMEI